jgi:inositol 3-alpha-galactosyltransferase
MEREDIKMLVKKWKEIYEDETLDYNNNVRVERFTAALLEAGGIKSVLSPNAA